MATLDAEAASLLPSDWKTARFVGRIDRGDGPTPILCVEGHAYDMARVAPTASVLVELGRVDAAAGTDLGLLDRLVEDPATLLLSPIDLQCVKAAGVTFAASTLERVIEERARGDADAAAAIRARLEDALGGSIGSVKPGSREAAALKTRLIEDDLWSQYLEVAIGPDAEIFTKAPVLATVGHGALIGIRSDSHWNNPEPEMVLLANARGEAVGATLGNDVNLRDLEGRSALLLGKAKDNNASAALGPLVRLFDEHYTLDDVRAAQVTLRVEGEDGFVLDGTSSMREISRDPLDLLAQAMSEHDYPDGLVLYCGTMFAPVKDRAATGGGFTHHVGDIVTISTPRLGALRNRVTTCDAAPPWRTGIGALMTNLSERGLLGRKEER